VDGQARAVAVRASLSLSLSHGWALLANAAGTVARFDGTELGRTKDVFVRWTQVAALNPIFENGGQTNHKPWLWDDETYQIYRMFLWLHEELRPFYYTRGVDAFARGASCAMRS
jgi:alpha-glucosidase (family GH31 glycosyl hydrolase)